MAPRKVPVLDRLKAKTSYEGECYIYTGCPSVDETKKAPQIRNEYSNLEAVGSVSYRLFKGPIPKGKQVNHTCDRPRCWRPEHVYAGTHLQNMKDKTIRGRHKGGVGDSHGNSLISSAQAAEIKRLLSTGMSRALISAKLAVSKNTVRFIAQGRSWQQA